MQKSNRWSCISFYLTVKGEVEVSLSTFVKMCFQQKTCVKLLTHIHNIFKYLYYKLMISSQLVKSVICTFLCEEGNK